MFKMVLIFAIRFIWSFSVTQFKSLTDHCTSGTVCMYITHNTPKYKSCHMYNASLMI